MGVLNVTPDSFSDGGQFTDVATALAHARTMVADGADWIDVGGESTRPGASPVPLAEEQRRVLPVVEALADEGIAVSIDTRTAEVAHAAVAAGATLINDVSSSLGQVAAECWREAAEAEARWTAGLAAAREGVNPAAYGRSWGRLNRAAGFRI